MATMMSYDTVKQIKKTTEDLDLPEDVAYLAMMLYSRVSRKTEVLPDKEGIIIGACVWFAAKMRGRDLRQKDVAAKLGCDAAEMWEISSDAMEVLGLKVLHVAGHRSIGHTMQVTCLVRFCRFCRYLVPIDQESCPVCVLIPSGSVAYD